jgi:cysteinyl-tRNA synthetase
MSDKEEKPQRWYNPKDTLKEPIYRTGLMVNNSLCNEKVEFFTKSGDRTINWYMCGPTVYDSAHLGHARTYLTFDIIRRILSNYFHYDVNLCMNITDIDDKIIQRSNEQKKNFSEFARYWEDSFFKDMRALNVMYPNYITRVSEYIPEIIAFIEVIIKNGYAYEKNGSVYFDIEAYKKGNHLYAKLVPQDKNQNLEELQEAEGALSKDNTGEKKNKGDFALWKTSKKDEPFWDSPWGKGRPGWHIECSVMSFSVFGQSLDIHSGGIDLKFPHHDNEIAQTEAHDESKQWINYFLHTGHLKIEGLKMSKSLKNFKKITDFISLYSPNAFRLYFCNSKWDMDMDFTENGLSMSSANDKKITEFFQNIKVWARENDLKRDLKFDPEDSALNKFFNESKKNIHQFFCDNFNTPGVVTSILDLIRKTYEYHDKCKQNKTLKLHLVYGVAKYISDILKCLGLVYNTEFVDYFRLSESDGGKNAEEILTPFINAITDFRGEVKDSCIADKDVKKVLSICDKLRDEILPNLGVRIEDKGNKEKSVWKFFDKEEYLKEKEKEKELKENKKKQKEAEAKEREHKLSLTAKEYYATLTDKYSEFDNDGVPTKNAKGNELSKEQYNKLKKEFAKHDKQHQKWLEQQEKKKEEGGNKKEKKKKKDKGEKKEEDKGEDNKEEEKLE